jgi:uncharacterized membrane protein
LLVAVFPANMEMVVHADRFPDIPFLALVTWLPLQAVLIAWVWWAAVKRQLAGSRYASARPNRP